MHQTEKFHLLTTGGTIDSYYDPDNCTAVCHTQSVLPEFLRQHCQVKPEDYLFTPLCSKDSRDIGETERLDLLQAVINSPLQAIVITHGSFTAFETGRFLNNRAELFAGKTVIITGALRPIDGFTYSDGLFNLGASALAAQYAPAGVYICIDGSLHTPDSREVWH